MRTSIVNSCEVCSSSDIEVEMDHSKWLEDVAKTTTKRSDMNHLVMNYLVMEGFKEAAEKFAQEADVASPIELGHLDDRIKVRKAVQDGKIEEAMRLVTNLHPEILDANDHLYFHLQQLVLIELIRNDKVEDAVLYAQEHLAAKGSSDPAVLTQLERTLALLAYDSPEASPFKDLLHPSHRLKVASELNAAMFEAQNHDVSSPKLTQLLKLLLWSQDQLTKKHVRFPNMTDLAGGNIGSQK